ncbi:MAG TPA: thioredoxin domain-containing protein [Polyangia bacterium]|nr:thioredoxin domain-containing protein [Polyangia bacterium]
MTLLSRAVDGKDWTKGPADAPVTLLEYGDFECPFCGQAFWELKRLEQAVGDRVRFVFRHFPLARAHPHARLAAEAAEAAGAQGRFWEMHDTLFSNQSALELSDLLAYADDIGLDRRRFTRDLQEHRFSPKVRRDFMEGVRSGVNGTPTIFIDGQRWDGPFTATALLAAIRGDRSPEVEPMTGLLWGVGTAGL